MKRTLFCSRLCVLLVGWMLSTTASRASDCPNYYEPDKLLEELRSGETAFSGRDAVGFSTSMETLGLMVPCVNALLSPDLSAQLHRAEAIRLYTAGDNTRSKASLLASRTLQPQYAFPETLFPKGYALLGEYDRIEASTEVGTTLPHPREGAFSFDGTLSRVRPTDRPTLFQHLSTDGAPLRTIYLRPGMPVPDYAINPKLRNLLLAGTFSAAAIAGGSYAFGKVNENRFHKKDSDYSLEDLQNFQSRTNLGYALAAGFTGLTAAGTISVVWVGER